MFSDYIVINLSGGRSVAQRGRPPKIAPQEQVARAMRLFWSRGYLDTRIEDLVDEAGANRFSLYASHGGKRGLYLKALELYRKEVMTQFLEPLAGDQTSLAEIHRFFAQFLPALDAPRSRLGCLICAAAVEAAALEPAIADRVAGYVAELKELFRTILERARARSELAADAEPAMLADHFVGAVVGVMTLARSPMPRPLVKNYVRGVLRFIESLARTPIPTPTHQLERSIPWSRSTR
jgi:TetR/AcrR family transcriptional repressor of nem operon